MEKKRVEDDMRKDLRAKPMGVVKEDVQMVGATVEDGRNRVRWRQMDTP